MTRNVSRTCFFIFLLCQLPSLVFSQSSEVETSLVSILTELQDIYEVQFNYAPSRLKDIRISAPPANLSLEEVLIYLKDKTQLSFERIGEKVVYVGKANSLTVCGFLINGSSKEPIVGATVYSSQASTFSDFSGFFELTVSDFEAEVSIRTIGYRSLHRKAAHFRKEGCATIGLFMQEEALNEIVLTSYLIRGIDKRKDGSLTVDFSNFSLLPGLIETDVLLSAQALPGIQSSNETVSNINIRGGSHDQNLILWDDIKMYQSGHFFGLISSFNPQATETVSIVKNGTKAAYTDGVSGTIVMQTEKRINPSTKANVGVNFLSADAFVDIPLGTTSSLQLGGRKSLNNLWETPTYGAYFDRIAQQTEIVNPEESIANSNQSFDFYDTTVRWLYHIDDNNLLRVNFLNIDNNLVFNESGSVDGSLRTRESRLSQNSIAGGIYYEHRWNSDQQTSLQIYESDYSLSASNANVLESQRFLQENVVSETGIRSQHSMKIRPNLWWKSGYNGVETEITNLDDVDVPVFRRLISKVLRTHSLFSQMEFESPNKKTHITGGLRYTYIDKFKKSLLEPRFSLSQDVSSGLSLSIAGELKHQNTSQIINFQNDFLGVEKRRWQLADNTEIPVIQSSQISAGIQFDRKGWLLDIDGYYKNVDGITAQSQGFQSKYEFVKAIGSYEVFGVDFLLRKELMNFSGWLSYAMMDNTYTFRRFPEMRFPSNFDIQHSINLGLTYTLRGIKISSGLHWHTGKPTTQLVTGEEILGVDLNFQDINSSRLQEYMRVDFSAVYRLKRNTWYADLGFSIWNVLDKKNIVDNTYRLNSNDIPIAISQNALGLTTNTMIRFYFN